jgi:carbamoyl-phosphate synthase large subunit
VKRTVSILLTGVGAPGTRGTIYALRKNKDEVRVRLVGTDLRKDALGKYWTESFHTLPPPESENYVDEVNRICRLHRIDLVLPQTTRETVALAMAEKRLSVPALVSSAASIRRANNKFELLRVFERLRLPRPKSHLVKSFPELRKRVVSLGYPEEPVIVKPPVSFGSRGFRILTKKSAWSLQRYLTEKPSATEITLEELGGILGRGEGPFPELMVSEYLPGVEYSVDAFIGAKGRVAIPRKREEIVNGISFKTALDYRSDIAENTLKAASELGLRYTFGFQYKLDRGGVPKVLECNPRVQGTMVASIFSGVNIIWLGVCERLGSPRTVPNARTLATFHRFWGGVGIEGDRLIDEI